ncbi:hypothetical protein [Serinibacter salmoneus]|uniref:Uncharacterized protein n=1 Tax=Serinibacter salmoneus TaxID=556530 RepID=A0A2A9CZG0_9MICO|nr:hypothetical protein [Serinibacter salmoneus]PFG19838.1 hypothetical protein ATL40_1414 [Serinibacter salmoneus]
MTRHAARSRALPRPGFALAGFALLALAVVLGLVRATLGLTMSTGWTAAPLIVAFVGAAVALRSEVDR